MDDKLKYVREPIAAQCAGHLERRRPRPVAGVGGTEDEPLAIILDRTNFYAEMGGQVGDVGTLTAGTSLDIGKLAQAGP